MAQIAITEPASVGNMEAPEITRLGVLDDEQGVAGMGLETQVTKPVMKIIYNGI